MGFNLKSLLKGKDKNAGANVGQVKTNLQTTDNIISQAVSNAGNISSMTLSKEEHAKLIEERKQVPFHITALKYVSLTFLVVTIVAGLLLKADLDPRNGYLGVLGMSDNTGSKFVKQSQLKNTLDQENKKIEKEIASLEERSLKFDDTKDENKVSLLVPEILEVEAQQKRWFSETVEVIDPLTDQLKEETHFGLIDSFSDMVEYFEHKEYQPRFFAEKNRNESLNRQEPELCNIANNKLGASELALKRQYENSGKCVTTSSLIMANELEIRGLNINANTANVTVSASDLLSRVFTLSSEFVAMMNSYPFYKGAEIVNFTRRELAEGGDGTEAALRLEFQDEEEEDPNDEFLTDLTDWQKNWR